MSVRTALLLLLLVTAGPAAAQNTQPPPCSTNDAWRAFDFWIGEWEVRMGGDQVAGTNRIESILGGCVLLENWTGAAGSAGKSFNHFDPSSGEWRQLWVDAGGGFMDYRGGYSDGAMRFEGTWVRGDGAVSSMRTTFTPREDGTVRQFIEQSTDDGASWATWFDGIYHRTDD